MRTSSRTQRGAARTYEPMQIAGKSKRNKERLGISKSQWVIQSPDDDAAQLAKSLKVSALLAQVLINRGITDVNAGAYFLRPKLTELISPEKMPGSVAAVQRIKQAITNKGKVTVYGDYDVDGITGVAILTAILEILGAEVDYYIPHRINEGYGLNAEAIEFLAKSGTQLLITVDCGITASKSVQLAGQLGLDLIITDHHQPSPQLPTATAIVHPAMDNSYVNQDSSGSMVAFKLAWAIANEFKAGQKLDDNLRDFMINATSLAAMGTIADCLDLRGENRILTHYGLKSLPDCKLCGIQALIESADLTGRELDSFDIGFRLAPMLNAAGRMGHARLAVELLTSKSSVRSMQIAQYLKDQNTQRQRCERNIFKQARKVIVEQQLSHPDRKSIVIAGKDWHTGIIGIVASHIVDQYHRPTIVIGLPSEPTDANGFAKGSARSIEGFDILNAVRACSEHLVDFGGHKMAAGITIETEKITQFAADFEIYAKQNLSQNDCVSKLFIDAEVPLSEFQMQRVAELQMLSPFGQGNPRPIFATKGVRMCSSPRRVGITGDHLQLAVTDGTNSIRCIGFGMGKLEKKLLEREFFNIAYEPQLNTYNGNCNVQLVLADIQFE